MEEAVVVAAVVFVTLFDFIVIPIETVEAEAEPIV